MATSGWGRWADGAKAVDLANRWPLYLASGSEPLVMALLVSGDPQGTGGDAAVLIPVSLVHAVACVLLLRAGIASHLEPRRTPWRLVTLAGAVTAAGLASTVLYLGTPGSTHTLSSGLAPGPPMLVLCAALTCALAPLLPTRRLLTAVAVPAAAAAGAEMALAPSGRPVWAVNYLLVVGTSALSYRFTVWLLGVTWELTRARDAQARLAVAEERLRFARDLHDVLGRNLALIAVNSDLAAQLARRGQDGAIERMEQVRRTAHESMREMREVVAGYRTVDLDAEMAGARSVLRSAGVQTRVVGDGATLPPAAQAALGWVVREATTNIIRHSDPHTVRIDLEITHSQIGGSVAVLQIENDGISVPGGHGSADSDGRGGAGLIGLRERLTALGGDVTTETRPGGTFRLCARLPIGTALPEVSSRPAPAEPAPVGPAP